MSVPGSGQGWHSDSNKIKINEVEMVKIVTDSSCDLTDEILKELNITMVPLSVRFGEEVFKERVDMSAEQFFQRLLKDPAHPATIQPNSADFLAAYEKACVGADGIVSIHISSKLSGTLNSARDAKNMLKNKCPVEIIDSKTVSVDLGNVVIAAAEAARQGKNMQEVVQVANEALNNVRALCLLDTLKFLEKGGRIGKAQALVGTVLNVKPIITVKDGEVVPYGRVRSFEKGLDQMVKFVQSYSDIQDILIAWTTEEKDARELAERISAFYKLKPVKVMRVGTTLGVHLGPGAIVLSLRCGSKT